MTLTDNEKKVHDIFGIHLGRDADAGGLDYWSGQLDAGKTAADIIRGIQSGSEYKNRAALVSGAGDAGITEAQLDKMVLPGGWKTEHYTGYDKADDGDLFDFNRGNTWATDGFGTQWAKKQNIVNTGLGATAANDYSTVAGENYGLYTGDPIVTDDDNTVITTEDDTVVTNDPVINNTGYLTASDLSSWWDSLDKPWLTQTDNTTANTSSNDDFMKLMMFMAMMRPQGGGYGGGQYGYGGLTPGGVQSAYNPMANLSSYMDAFKNLPGVSTSTISTGSN